MPTKIVRPLKDVDNTALLNAIRRDASLEYRQRVPEITDGKIQKTIESIMEFQGIKNEMLDSLINRIGRVIARNNSWSNPLAIFKQGLLTYGSTVEEIQTGLISARVYEHDREHMERDIFGTHRPDVKTSFHSVNREEYYPISINDDQLRRAFLDDGGLASFVTMLMEAPSTSDSWDEFQLMCSLFPRYEGQDGFFKVKIPDMTGLSGIDADDAKLALRTMRAMAGELPFLSTRYNAAGMPVSAKADDLILLTTPQMQANVDVEALAGAFNIEKAQMPGRIVTIPRDRFGIDGAQAILTTADFFMVLDQVLDTTSQYNPVARQTNYFLHHWEVISASRFAPAIMFTSKDGTVVINSAPLAIATMSKPTFTDSDNMPVVKLAPGGVYNILSNPMDAEGKILDSGVFFTVAGNVSTGTYIRGDVLHVGQSETATALDVAAFSSYVNPANPQAEPIFKLTKVTVEGPHYDGWGETVTPPKPIAGGN